MSLKTKYKERPIERIRETFGQEIQGVIDVFKEYNYIINQETYERFRELGLNIE